MNGLLIVSIAVLAIGACSRPASMEDRLIGTWEMPAVTIIYDANTPNAPFPIKSKDVVEITFTADHKEVWRSRGGPIETVARWHLEGNDLVITLETQTEAGPPGTTKRETIKKITSDELVFTDGTTEGRWTRVK